MEDKQPGDAESVQEPKGTPPDKGLAYDPAMTEADEANIPPASSADPNAEEKREEQGDSPS